MGDSELNGQKGSWDQTVAALAGHAGETGLYPNGMGSLLQASTSLKCLHMYLNLTQPGVSPFDVVIPIVEMKEMGL